MPPPKQCGIVIRDNAAQTRHDEERHQGHKSRSHHDPPRPTSNRNKHGASQEGNSKKANPPPPPPPSPPSGHHGGRGPRRSRIPSLVDNKKKNPEPYDARSRIDKIHEAREGPYLGPRCFGPAIRSTTYPKGFRIDKTIKPYDGTAKPATWLQDYDNAVDIAGGNPNVAVKYLPLMLAGTARQWIDDLPEKCIYNWLDMQEAFTKNFEGTYKRPCTVDDLQRCVQEKDETSHAYLSRWLDMKNSCAGVHAQTAMV